MWIFTMVINKTTPKIIKTFKSKSYADLEITNMKENR